METYTKRQILFFITIALADFGTSLCYSLQAPFYPAEAEKKGATASQYGLVFGIFELTVFLVSLVYGKYMAVIGPGFLLMAGLFMTGSTCILFGFLDRVIDRNAFLGLSYAIRITEGLGTAAFLTTSFSLIAIEFPESIGRTFATLDLFYGAGLTLGPTIGGALYELGGYSLPFISLGSTLIIGVFVIKAIIPQDDSSNISSPDNGQLIKIISIPIVAILVYTNIVSAICFGFLQATLEPHLRPLGLNPFKIGLMFIINGGTYIVFVPLWGLLCDKYVHPRHITAIGSAFTMLSFLFIGPVSFIPLETSISLCIVSLLAYGIGLSAAIVGTFSGTQQEVLQQGFPDDLNTYSLVSGIWTSSFSLGTFIGPTAAGVLYDVMGFRNATILIVGLHFFALLMFSAHHLYESYFRAPRSSIGLLGDIDDEARTLLEAVDCIYATYDTFNYGYDASAETSLEMRESCSYVY